MNSFKSLCPATGAVLWEGSEAGHDQVNAAVARARAAFPAWSEAPLFERIAHVDAYEAVLRANRDRLARTIAQETGKPLWEADQEVGSMIGKIAMSVQAQKERAAEVKRTMAFGHAVLRHRPHGVMAVYGPHNFPGHLPNGHIVPALLAGNVVVFKPSEETPLVGELMASIWFEAGLPAGVLTLVQGGRDTGVSLAEARIDGLLFTGSAATGAALRRQFATRPEVILALELGGNNPLIAWGGDPAAVASIVVASAFISTGQRCTCARRLILPNGAEGDAMLAAVVRLAGRLAVGQWDESPEPGIGPLISERAAQRVHAAFADLVSRGARPVLALHEVSGRSGAFVTPGIVDVTGIDAPDEEIFGPVLQVHRVPDFESAITVANDTGYGLAGGLISPDAALWRHYASRARAGVVNWNRPTTGAAGTMPFGGLGASGNFRPSGYYAADYCAWPMASFEAAAVTDQSGEIRGLTPIDRRGAAYA